MRRKEGKRTRQHALHCLLHRRIVDVTTRHEAVVEVKVVVGLGGGEALLNCLEPGAVGKVVGRVALDSAIKCVFKVYMLMNVSHGICGCSTRGRHTSTPSKHGELTQSDLT